MRAGGSKLSNKVKEVGGRFRIYMTGRNIRN